MDMEAQDLNNNNYRQPSFIFKPVKGATVVINCCKCGCNFDMEHDKFDKEYFTECPYCHTKMRIK